MIGEERFITAIITQAVEDASYQGTSKKYLKHVFTDVDRHLNIEAESSNNNKGMKH